MLSKQAVDQAAKSYWEKYYKEYGKAWVREIPKRIKSAVAKQAGFKDEEGLLVPTARVERGENQIFEGTYRTAQEGAAVFTITIGPEGAVIGEPKVMHLPLEEMAEGIEIEGPEHHEEGTGKPGTEAPTDHHD